jgi:glycerol-3-phosphate O-acyltransferase
MQHITLPLWLFALLCAAALIGLFDRLLLPYYRWVIRERVNNKIDTLNSRLKLRIQPFKLTKRESLIDRILFDKDILAAIELEAKTKNVPRGILMDRVKLYAREIVPNFNATTYFKVGTAGAKFISQAFYRVRLGYSDDNALKNIDPDAIDLQ